MPAVPAPVPPPGRSANAAINHRRPRRHHSAPAPPQAAPSRFTGALPARESFREAKFRVQESAHQPGAHPTASTCRTRSRSGARSSRACLRQDRRPRRDLPSRAQSACECSSRSTDEILGLGPLEPLLRDETLTEVMVNGPQQVYIERERQAGSTNVTFQNDEHVMKIIQRIIAIGRRVLTSRARWWTPGLAAWLPRQRHHPAAVAHRPGHHHFESSPPRPTRSTTSSASARPPRRCSSSWRPA